MIPAEEISAAAQDAKYEERDTPEHEFRALEDVLDALDDVISGLAAGITPTGEDSARFTAAAATLLGTVRAGMGAGL